MTASEFAEALIRYCVAMDGEVAWWGPSVPNVGPRYERHAGALYEWTAAEVTYHNPHELLRREAMADLLGLRLEPLGNRDRLVAGAGRLP